MRAKGTTNIMTLTLSGLALFGAVVVGSTFDEKVVRRTTPLQWGLYQILWSREYNKQLEQELAKFASKPDYVMFYRDLQRLFPKSPVDCIAKQGATAIVALELWSWHGKKQGSYLPDINRGAYDDFFRRWAQDAKTDGRRILLRFGFEFNGNWFTWSGNPEAYVKAWRRAHDIFRRVGAANVEWVWSPNVVSAPDTDENNMHRYYPGDAYVDWVGVDGYNFGDNHDQWHRWQSFAEVYDEVLADLARRYPDKPIIISEFGCPPGKPGQRERWIRDAHERLQFHPRVRAAIWFNYDKRREREPDWRIDVTPESLKAFNETFAAPRKSDR